MRLPRPGTAAVAAAALLSGRGNDGEMTANTVCSGLDLSFRDTAIRPQDDLFGHVNGHWLREYCIPADRAIDGAFRALHDRAEEQVRELLNAAAENTVSAPAVRGEHTDEQRIGDLYASFLDEAAIERRGVQPLLDELAHIDAATHPAELAATMGTLQRRGVGAGVGLYIDTDAKNSSRYLLHINQAGLGLPDESYYREEQHAAVLEAYPGHIAAMFAAVLGGDQQDHAPTAARIVAIESALAAAHWDVVKRRDADATYNMHRIADLPELAPGFDWTSWIAAVCNSPKIAAAITDVIVRQPDYLTAFAELWSHEDFSDWKDWARWRLIHSRAAILPRTVVEEDFAFYGRTLSGTEQLRERWKRAVSLVESILGDAVGRLYVQQHFPPDAKARMDILVDNVRQAYHSSISTLEWMTPQTRDRALVKLDKFTAKIGYPQHWRAYDTLIISRDDLYGNIIRGAEVNFDREMNKLGGPVDHDEWFMTPQTVNAYYNPGMNEIVFPAAILQPPFFDATADDAANYGGIGAVIGHEIGHGFDDQGAKYDGDGNLTDWWTDSDRAEFSTRTAQLIEQYDSFIPRDLVEHDGPPRVQGAFTIGENIGDLGGLAIALQAYQLSLDGKPAPVIDGLTGVQRVFFGWAQVWRMKARSAEAIRRLAIDPHSPPEFRCNGVVRNIDAFYEAFDVNEDDALYLAPQHRVRIWN